MLTIFIWCYEMLPSLIWWKIPSNIAVLNMQINTVKHDFKQFEQVLTYFYFPLSLTRWIKELKLCFSFLSCRFPLGWNFSCALCCSSSSLKYQLHFPALLVVHSHCIPNQIFQFFIPKYSISSLLRKKLLKSGGRNRKESAKDTGECFMSSLL